MRPLALAVLAIIPALGLAACESDGGPGYRGGLGDDMARLQRDCDARGGILIPTGRTTGHPPQDNVCRITGVSTPPPPER